MFFYLLLILLVLLLFGILVLLGGLLYAMRTGFNEVIKALETVTAERSRRDDG